jgi:hypothetical protein
MFAFGGKLMWGAKKLSQTLNYSRTSLRRRGEGDCIENVQFRKLVISVCKMIFMMMMMLPFSLEAYHPSTTLKIKIYEAMIHHYFITIAIVQVE